MVESYRIMQIFKLVITFILLCFCASSVDAQELSRLYLVKNAEKESLTSITDVYLINENYKLIKRDDYFIRSPKDNAAENSYYILMIKQTGNDCYFYYLSNNEKSNLDSLLLKEFKNGKYKTKKLKNKQASDIFYADATALRQRVSSAGFKKGAKSSKYDFSDEAQARFDTQKSKYQGIKVNKNKVTSENKSTENQPPALQPKPVSETAPKIKTLAGSVIYIPQGAEFDATIQSAVSSNSLAKNDTITAVLDNDWYYKGILIAPAGSIVYGKAEDVKKAGYAYGNGQLTFSFNELMTPKGMKISLSTNKVFIKANGSRTAKIVANVATGAIAGVVTGTLYALCTGGDVVGGLAIGAGVGAGAGGVFSLTQKGEDAEIPQGTNIQIRLTQPMNTSAYF